MGELQQHIDTVCLPDPEEQFDGQNCFATGWGKDQFGAAGEYQVVLKEIDLSVVGHQQCQDSLRRTRLGRRFQLDESFICAGGVAGKDTCKGDGGSPLVKARETHSPMFRLVWLPGALDAVKTPPLVFTLLSQRLCAGLTTVCPATRGDCPGTSPATGAILTNARLGWMEKGADSMGKLRQCRTLIH